MTPGELGFVLFLVGVFGGWAFGFVAGWTIGNRATQSRDRLGLSLKAELNRAYGKIGTVPDFIPPGDKAEIVEIDRAQWRFYGNESSRIIHRAPCAGCRYAGRYVLAKDGD